MFKRKELEQLGRLKNIGMRARYQFTAHIDTKCSFHFKVAMEKLGGKSNLLKLPNNSTIATCLLSPLNSSTTSLKKQNLPFFSSNFLKYE